MSEEIKHVSLTIKQIKKLISNRFINRHIKTRSIVIRGHRGVGKSDLVRQVGEELSKELRRPVRVLLTNFQFLESPDLNGLSEILAFDTNGNPVNPNSDEGLRSKRITRYAVADLVPTSDEYTIWFIDEFNRVNRDIRQALLTLVQDRSIHGIPLGKNTIIVGAMNPAEQDGVQYEVQEMDSALRDRISIVDFKPSDREFIEYMSKKHGANHAVTRWIVNQPDIIDWKGQKTTCPRSLDYLAAAIEVEVGKDGDPKKAFNAIAAEIGMEAASTFLNFLDSPDFLRAEDIIDEYDKAIAKRIKVLDEKGRVDVLQTLINGICSVLSHRGNDKINDDMLDNLTKFLEDSTAESKGAFFLALGDVIQETPFFNRIVEHVTKKSKHILSFLQRHKSKLEDKMKGDTKK